MLLGLSSGLFHFITLTPRAYFPVRNMAETGALRDQNDHLRPCIDPPFGAVTHGQLHIRRHPGDPRAGP